MEDLIDVVEERGATVEALAGSLRLTDGGTADQRFLARVLVSHANMSSAETARRVAAARLRQAVNGVYGGGKRPYGFEVDGITVKPDEAKVIRDAVDAVLGKVSLRAIALDLRKGNVPTVNGARWSPETLRDILLRPRNAGIAVYRPTGKRVIGEDGEERRAPRNYTLEDEVGRLPGEPILQEDVWRAVAEKLTDPARATRPGPARKWLGSGIYRCVCGTVMQVLARGDRVSPAYRCKDTGFGNGVQHVVRSVAGVDGAVVDVIVDRLSRPDAADLLAAPAEEGIDANAVRKQIAVWRQKLLTYADDEREDRITRAQLFRNTKVLNGKIADAQATLAEHTERSVLSPLIGAADVRAAWDALSLGAQRAVIKDLLVVTILPGAGRGRSPFDPASVRIEPRA